MMFSSFTRAGHIASAITGGLVVAVAAAAVGVGIADNRSAATPLAGIYMGKVKGAKQGEFKGEVVSKGREGWFRAVDFNYEVDSPRDAATGQASSRRANKPIRIRCDVGDASPKFFNAINAGEVFPEIEFRIVTPLASGAETDLITIRLTSATLASVRLATDETGGRPSVHLELEFNYSGIDITSAGGARSGSK